MLENFKELPSDFELYVPKSMKEPDSWQIMMDCMVLHEDDIDPEEIDGVPPIAKTHDYICVLGLWDIDSVLGNLKHQTDQINVELFFKAVKHFYANDAYIEV